MITIMITIMIIRGSIHQGHEAFSKHSRGRQCAFMSLTALHFKRSNSVDLWTQTNIDGILCHGDRMYLHALTNALDRQKKVYLRHLCDAGIVKQCS